jgi:hypothetical protein
VTVTIRFFGDDLMNLLTHALLISEASLQSAPRKGPPHSSTITLSLLLLRIPSPARTIKETTLDTELHARLLVCNTWAST